ncbi:hypothetical protein [Vibrio diazotrophicus]|uniref:hypothetical protein n=1 Tax=Vibrio diazotrophicus TaxID=685 RepID=UPI000C9E184D|nr:hypothetical protein [Vibrio diazotrophicus]PNH81337.1 hypothetical protein C1N27_07275 [Vibrio diazotrophicus]
MSESNNDLVYRQIIDNKLALKQLQKFESRLISHEKKIQKLKQTTANIEAKQLRASTRKAQTEERKQVNASQKAEIQKQKLAEQTARKNATFEKWKLTQFRSATYAKMKLSDQLKVKEILNSKESHEVIKDNLQKEIALIRRRNVLEQSRAKKQKSVVTGGNVGKNAASGAAGGGMIAGAMMNPYVLGTAAVLGGGAMAVKAGSEDYKNLQQGAQLTGMDFNTYARESAGMAAVSGMSQETISDKFKDIADRQGEFLNESTFNQKTGQYEGGEGSILANQLLKTGMSQDQVMQTMQLDPAEFTKTVSEALKDTDIKTQTFALEAFASDLTNIVKGMQENRSGYESAKANATTFNDNDIAKAKEFQLALSGIASSLGQIPLNIFKEFTNSLSPQTLEMLGKLGEAIGKLGGIFGDVLAIVLNLVSVGLSPLLDVVNWLLDAIKPLTEIMGEWSQSIQTTYQVISEMVKNFVKGLISAIPDFLLPDNLKSKEKETDTKPDSQTPTTETPNVKPYQEMYTRPTLPAYNPYSGGLGVNNNSTTNNTTNNAPNITVQTVLDGQVIAQSVVKSQDFADGVNRQVGSGMVGSR